MTDEPSNLPFTVTVQGAEALDKVSKSVADLATVSADLKKHMGSLSEGMRENFDGLGKSIKQSMAPMRELLSVFSLASTEAEISTRRISALKKEFTNSEINRATGDLRKEVALLNIEKKKYQAEVDDVNRLREELNKASSSQAAAQSKMDALVASRKNFLRKDGEVSGNTPRAAADEYRGSALEKQAAELSISGLKAKLGSLSGSEKNLSDIESKLKLLNTGIERVMLNIGKISQLDTASKNLNQYLFKQAKTESTSDDADTMGRVRFQLKAINKEKIGAAKEAQDEASKDSSLNASAKRLNQYLYGVEEDSSVGRGKELLSSFRFQIKDITKQKLAEATAAANAAAKDTSLTSASVRLNKFLFGVDETESANRGKDLLTSFRSQLKAINKEKLDAQKAASAEANAEADKQAKLDLASIRLNQLMAKQQLQKNIDDNKPVQTPKQPAPTKSFDDKWADRNANLFGDGGANFLALQARIMLGYQALNVVIGQITGSVQSVVDLQDALKSLQAITATSYIDMESLKKVILDTGATTKFTTVEIAKAATVLGQAGLSAREIAKALPAITGLAAAMGGDLNSAVDVATSAMGAFNLQASDMGHISNVMAAAMNQSKLDIDKLALGLQYAGNVAGESGITITEFNAILATMSDRGIKSGATLGTGIRELINEFTAPTAKLINYLKIIGLTEDDISIKTHGFIGVMKNLSEAGFTASDAMKALSIRGGNAYSALSQGIDGIDAQIASFNESSAVIEANAIQMESLKATWVSFQNVITATTDTVLTGPMLFLQKTLAQVRDALKSVNDTAGGMLRILGDVGMGAVVVMMSKWALSLLKVGELLSGLIAQLRLLPGLLAGLAAFNPFGWVGAVVAGIAVAAGAAVAYVVSQNEVRDSLKDLNKAFDENKSHLDAIKGEYDSLHGRLESVSSTIVNLYNRQERLTSNSTELKTAVSEARSRFGDLNKELFTNIDTFDKLVSALKNVKVAIDDLSKDKLLALQIELKTGIDLAMTKFHEAKGNALAEIQSLGVQGFGPTTLPTSLRTPDSLKALELIQRTSEPSGSEEASASIRAISQLLVSMREQVLKPEGKSVELIDMYQKKLIPGLENVVKALELAKEGYDKIAAAKEGIKASDQDKRFQSLGADATGGTSKNPLVNRVAGELGYGWMGSAFDAIINQESGGNHIDPRTGKINTSKSGALGLMQMMPETFKAIAKPNKNGFGPSPDIANEEDNLRAGILEFMKLLTDPQHGGVENALIGYNAGPGYITNGKPLFKETQNYVKKLSGPVYAAYDAVPGNAKARYDQLRAEIAKTNKDLDETSKDGGNPLKTDQILDKKQKQLVEAKAIEEILKRDNAEHGGKDVSIAEYQTLGNEGLIQLEASRKKNKSDLVKLYTDQLATNAAESKKIEKLAELVSPANVGDIEKLKKQGEMLEATRLELEKGKAKAEHSDSPYNYEAAVKEAVAKMMANRETLSKFFTKQQEAIESLRKAEDHTTLDAHLKDITDKERKLTNAEKLADATSQFGQSQKTASNLQAASGFYKGGEGVFASLGAQATQQADQARKDMLELQTRLLNEQRVAYEQILATGRQDLAAAAKATEEETKKLNALKGQANTRHEQLASNERLKTLEGDRAKALALVDSTETKILAIKQKQVAVADEQKAADIIKKDNLADLLVLQMKLEMIDLGKGGSFNASLAEGFGGAMKNMRQSMGQFFTDWETGVHRGSDAFKQFVSGILKSMLQVINDAIAKQFMKMILGFALKIFGGVDGGSADAGGGGAKGEADGGPILPRYASGGPISGGTPDKDSVPVVTMPGEWVINQKAVKSVGNDFMKSLNDNGAAALKATQPIMNLSQVTANNNNNGHVNVWVVSPDQTPPPGPKDIIATVAQNISQNGQIKQMIQSVAMGRV